MSFRTRRTWVLAAIAVMTAGALLVEAQPAPNTLPTTSTLTQPGGGHPTEPADGAQARQAGGAHTQPIDRSQSQPAGNSQSRPTTSPQTQPSTRPTSLTLNFKDAPLDSVLDYLSGVAGFTVIKEGPVDGRVTVLSKQPVTREQAVTMLNAALKANGFAAVQSGEWELRIIPRDKAKKSNIPVHFGQDPNDVADTDELITQVIPVHNVDATKLRQDLQPLIPPDADTAANDGSNTIVITDASSVIKRIVRIIYAMDQEETTVSQMRIVQLKFASAADAVKLIEAVFKGEGGGGGGNPQGPQQVVMGPNGPMPPGGGGGGGAHRQRTKVVAAADERTNILVLNGPADSLKVIDDILQKLDSNPAPASVIRGFPLKYADAETTSKLIDNVFHPQEQQSGYPYYYFGGFDRGNQSSKAKINTAFDDRTNTVIVTAPADLMKQIEELINSLDASPVSASAIRVFPLKYADSYSVAKLITSIFNPDNDQGGSARRFFSFFFGNGPMSGQSQKGVKVNATSDDRTNNVIVTAPQETMKIIEGIIKQLDSNPAAEDTLFIYHLRNGQASNLELVLNTLFGNVQNGQGPQQQPNQGGPGGNRNQNGNNQFGNNSRGLGNRDNNNQSGFNRNRPANQPGSNRPKLSPGMAQAANALTGEVFVVADEDTNSLIVTTASRYEKQVRQIIEELDRPVPQVLIKVLVAEVTHDNSADFGADFSILNQRGTSGFGQNFTQSFGAPSSGLAIAFLEKRLEATLHALAQQNKLDVLSRPYILASDNQLAEILVGQQVPLITSSYPTELGQVISNYTYEKVGIIVDVTPHINPDGLVTLDVAPEISQLTAQTVNVGPNISAPVIADRSAQSRVSIRDGQTIVIGGLMQDQKTLTINKVPILGDIPLIKYAFSRTQVDKTKTELLIFLTPHVAQSPDLLKSMSQDEQKGTKLTPNAVEPGTFQEHLRGLQRGAAPATQPAKAVSPIFIPTPDTQPAPDHGESLNAATR